MLKSIKKWKNSGSLTEEGVSQGNGLWGERRVEAPSISGNNCWLTDEGLDDVGSFPFLSLRVGDREVSHIVRAHGQTVLSEGGKREWILLRSRQQTLTKEPALPYLSSTQADVELVEIFGSFRGEARTVHQWPHWPQWRKVKGQSGVTHRMCEVTVAVA